MHKIAEKEFMLEDFSCEHLDLDNYDLLKKIIVRLNRYRGIYINGGIVEYPDCGGQIFEPKSKKIWWQLIQLLPSSYNQTRNVMLNYEVLANIYRQRKSHKLDEWREFCGWIESLQYSELVIMDSREAIKEELRKEFMKASEFPAPFHVYDTAEYAKLHPDWLSKVQAMANPGLLVPADEIKTGAIDMDEQYIHMSKDDIQDILDHNIKSGSEAPEEE